MPKLLHRSPYQRHKAKWSNCDQCPLSQNREKVVLARGSVPCDVLFIGEAPGTAENVLGIPFVGQAGKLLDMIIEDAWDRTESEATKAFTNLIACIPLDESSSKTHEPPTKSIKACAPRLREFVELSSPNAIVAVGSHSKKWSEELIDRTGCLWTSIVHPAAILRFDISQKPLAIQRCVVAIMDILEDLK